ncbi:PEPxxWA-CTERM sorting domain-containing protein [Sphingomonas nostoxanthinifaciens]|uniref:PEPxxWA-CTERM sorting domain-containing protein n=1 Tax=Sphingomonas nostoxanthinifaciens TaxID=2872652 RepID=UPI001CC1EA0E|nr:PEPxxWA-CTERM sorting domain-containing protein [Sphingomonas nostoxanthinifaciens]UAK23696.1 PEPxxWA-CTERM sorting domain-containing protein [Sphingomonas nostoxanthinifaciens]
MTKLKLITAASVAMTASLLAYSPARADRVVITENGFSDNGKLVVDLTFSQPGTYYARDHIVGGFATYTSDITAAFSLPATTINAGFYYLSDRSFSINFYQDDDHSIYILSDPGIIEDFDFHYALALNGSAVSEAYNPITIVHLPSVAPEPASWALMLGGFAVIGAGMRRRQRESVSFA